MTRRGDEEGKERGRTRMKKGKGLRDGAKEKG